MENSLLEFSDSVRQKIIQQKCLWNKQHNLREREHQGLENVPNISAMNVIGYIPEGGTVLEIGAGNGRDARYFIKTKNCIVLATDFSEEAITQMTNAAKRDGTFEKLKTILTDTRDLEAPAPNSLDMLYARSSLHLSDKELFRFFEKVLPALKTGGYIFIEGKTTRDLKIARSTAVDENLLEDKDGHLRRSWNSDFIQDLCVKLGVELVEISDTTEFWHEKETHFINFLARKK